MQTRLDTFSKNFGIGLDYSLTVNNTHFFGEFSILKGKWAFLNGANIHLSKQAVFSILFRSISPLYNPLQANIFAEYYGANNEMGVFSSFQFKLNSRWKASYYIDLY